MRPVGAVLILALALLTPVGAAIVPPTTITVDPCGVTVGTDGLELARETARPAIFREDFDDLTTWSTSGLGHALAPASGETGCHLVSSPVCCGEYRDFSYTQEIVAGGPIDISMAFQGAVTSGDVDVLFEAIGSNGHNLVLATTEGVGFPNNGVQLYYGKADVTHGQTGTFYALDSEDWYTLGIRIYPDEGRVHAYVRDASGALLASSEDLPIDVGDFEVFSTLRFRGVGYSTGGQTLYRWDTLVIEALGSLPFGDDFDSLVGWTVSADHADIECGDGAPGCYVRTTPVCCNAYNTLSRDVDLLTDGAFDLSLKFRGSTLHGDVDAVYQFIQPDGLTICLTITEGYADSNNGLRLFYGDSITETIYTDTGEFGSWDATGEWYTAVIRTVPATGTASAKVYDATGALVAASPSLDVGVGNFQELSAIRIHTVTYGTDATYDWDTLRVTSA